MKSTRHFAIVVAGLTVASALFASGSVKASEPFFMGLGDLPEGNTRSVVYGLSADGSTVVGDSNVADGQHAYIWTMATGMQDLGPGIALAASADGSVVAGEGLLDVGIYDGFRWTEASGKQAIGMPDSVGYGMGVSSDGSVIVGADAQGATRWTQATGTVPLDSPFPGHLSAASDVSDDGVVVVGQQTTPPLNREQAFRWTQSTGMTLLGTLFGAGGSVATATNADGSVVVGFTGWGFFEAWRWTPSGGMVGLGDLPGGEYSSTAWDVSPDGSLVVGFSSTNNGFEAFVWDAANGMRNLKSLFLNEGLDLTGWTLTQAKAVSADGRTFAGDGINPQGNEEAWIASLGSAVPEPNAALLLLLGVVGLQWRIMRRVRRLP